MMEESRLLPMKSIHINVTRRLGVLSARALVPLIGWYYFR